MSGPQPLGRCPSCGGALFVAHTITARAAVVRCTDCLFVSTFEFDWDGNLLPSPDDTSRDMSVPPGVS